MVRKPFFPPTSRNVTKKIIVFFGCTGTAIYAYFIIANTVQFATTLTNTTFELDGEPVGRFVHIPTPDDSYLYNVPGYVNTTLQPGRHQLNIIGTGDTDSSFISFDYAVYTCVYLFYFIMSVSHFSRFVWFADSTTKPAHLQQPPPLLPPLLQTSPQAPHPPNPIYLPALAL